MSSEPLNEPIYYNSTYVHGVDEKRRVQIPSKWRPQKPHYLTLILWPRGSMIDACIHVLPPLEWERLVAKAQSLPFADPKAQALRRLIGKKSDRVLLDRGGRICIPEAMATAAAIGKEAALVGLIDRFEIWNPKRHEAAGAEDDQMQHLAFELI